MIKVKASAFLLSSTFFFAACSVASTDNSEELSVLAKKEQEKTIAGFISELANNNQEGALKFVTKSKDNGILTSEGLSFISKEYLDDRLLEEAVKRHTSKLKYKINGEIEKDGEVVYELELTYSNAIFPLLEASGELMEDEHTKGKSEEEIDKITNEIIIKKLNEGIEEKKSSGTITLSKEDEKWVITSIDENTRNAILMNSIKVIES